MRPRLTYANVIATLALFLALGGGAYAVSGGFAGSGGKLRACVSKKRGTLRLVGPGARCRKKTEMAVEWNQTGPAGAAGAAGAAGGKGDTGTPGDRGPSDGYFATGNPATLQLPPGFYLATGKGSADSLLDATVASALSCRLHRTDGLGFDNGDFSSATVPVNGKKDFGNKQYGSANAQNSLAFNLPNGGTIEETCAKDDFGQNNITIYDVTVSAIRVAVLH